MVQKHLQELMRDELREALKSFGLSTARSKVNLTERLEIFMKEKGEDPEKCTFELVEKKGDPAIQWRQC